MSRRVALFVGKLAEVLTMSDAAQEIPFDAAKAAAFAGSLLQTLNHGAWCLMASIGHRTGPLRHHARSPGVDGAGHRARRQPQ